MSVAHDAEQSVLGGILLDCERLPPGIDTLRPGDFSDALHAAIFSAMLSVHTRNEPIDAVTVHAEIKSGGTEPRPNWESYLAELTDSMPTSANVPIYANIVRREARRRDMLKACARAFELAKVEGSDGDEIMQGLTLDLARLAAGRELTRPVTMRELVREEFKAIEKRVGEKAVVGLETGYPTLDGLLGGLQPGGLVIIAGRPSMGKSMLATNIVENMALRGGKSALVFSLEMTNQEQVQRSLAAEARVDLHKIRSGQGLRDTDWPKLAAAVQRLHTDQIALCDKPGLSVTEVRSVARQYNARRKLDVLVVDYLQLMEGVGQSREQEVSSISRGLKALAMELRVPVIALSQLNRSLESRTEKRPALSDLRESGSLEQDASQVLLLYRDEYYNPKTQEPDIAEIGVAKNRNGPTGMVKLRYSGKYTRFESLDAREVAA